MAFLSGFCFSYIVLSTHHLSSNALISGFLFSPLDHFLYMEYVLGQRRLSHLFITFPTSADGSPISLVFKLMLDLLIILGAYRNMGGKKLSFWFICFIPFL